VAVAEGTVVCSPRDGASWQPVRLRPGEALAVRYPAREAPSVERASPADLEEIRRWSQQVSSAPGQGYCCDGSRVFPALSNQCGGQFRWTESEARQACADMQPGYCCSSGRLSQTTRGSCYGQFFTNAEAARRACVPPQQPQQQQTPQRSQTIRSPAQRLPDVLTEPQPPVIR